MIDEVNPTKTPAELEKEYFQEVRRTVRKQQLIDFVHFYYKHLDELTFNQIVKEFNEQPYEKATTDF